MRDYVNYVPPKPQPITLKQGFKMLLVGIENFLQARY